MAKKKEKSPGKEPKHINFRLIERAAKTEENRWPYKLLDEAIKEDHEDVADAKILIAWHLGDVKEDVDGTKGFGRVRRGNDLDRDLRDVDFVIMLPHKIWQGSEEHVQRAMIDHHLCSCAPVLDKNGEQVVDERSRLCWRIRKPYKMFVENIRRYGPWQQEKFATAIASFNDTKRPLLPKEPKKKGGGFGDPAHQPADQAAAEHVNGTNGHAAGGSLDPWGVSIDVLKLPKGVSATLRDLEIETVRELADHEATAKESLFDGAGGLGSDCGEKLRAAFHNFTAAHPATAN